MCSWIGKSLTLLLLALGFLIPSWGAAANFRSLESGLEYAQLRPSEQSSTQLHVLRLDLKKIQVRVLDARDYQKTSMTAPGFAEKSGALAAINANFFDDQHQPLGLVLQNGKLKKNPQKTSWFAALLLQGTQARILKIATKEETQGADEGIQSGPRLVIAGAVPKLKAESSPKSAVGLDRKGRLYVVASEGGMDIQDLANFLALPEKKGGLGLWNALNLDGGSSTQFFAKVGKFELSIPALNQVPIALGIFRRAK